MPAAIAFTASAAMRRASTMVVLVPVASLARHIPRRLAKHGDPSVSRSVRILDGTRHRDAVTGEERRHAAGTMLYEDVAAVRTQCDLHRVRQQIGARQHAQAARAAEMKCLGHGLLLPSRRFDFCFDERRFGHLSEEGRIAKFLWAAAAHDCLSSGFRKP